MSRRNRWERDDHDDDHNGRSRDNGREQEGYQFNITGNTVNSVYEFEHGRLKLERMDADETWSFDGSSVTKTEYEHGRLEITTYSDLDGDGIYTVSGKSYGAATTPTYTIYNNDYDSSSSAYSSDTTYSSYVPTYTTSGYTTPSIYSTSAYAPPSVAYNFGILDGAVVSATRSINGYEQNLRLGWNESWELRGNDIAKVESKWSENELTLYTDDDTDGAYDLSLDIDVKTTTTARSYEDNKFVLEDGSLADGATLFEGDVIASQLEANRWGWKTERLDWDETLNAREIDGSIYVVKTETHRSGALEFTLYRDDDADGLWTEVADGKAYAAFQDEFGGLDALRLEDTGVLADTYGIIA